MSAVMKAPDVRDAYLASLAPDVHSLAGPGPEWLNALRAEAAACVNSQPYPTTQDEEWRFTDFGLLRKTAFASAADISLEVSLADIEPFVLPESEKSRLVFVNGIYAPHLSACAGLPQGVVISNLAAGLPLHDAVIRTHLAQQVDFHNEAFAALNTSHIRDGALVLITKDTACPAPIHLLFIATGADMPQANYPRCLIIADAGSTCALIEDYVCLNQGVYFTSAVSEITLGENAAVEHTRLQRESLSAFHMAYGAVALARGSNYTAHNIAFGARISRHDLRIKQNGEAAQCTLNGLALISGRQIADTHTVMDHTKPNGQSTQLHKCIADGGAHAVFNGKIFVRKDAQHTNAAQQSRNLLLSNKARIDTKPQLEIFADDVKCAHGATVSQLETEEMFYLNSRGLDALTARNLLIYGFAEEIVDRIPVTSLIKQLSKTLSEQILEHT